MEPPEYDSWTLQGAPDQVARARRLVTAALGPSHPLHDDSVLLTSELATNAVVHSAARDGGTFTVSVLSSQSRVRVCVTDGGSEAPPCACRTSLTSQSGRGLPLLEALSHRWGFTRQNGVNTVWFELVLVTVPAGWAAAGV
ncbi:MULTISPECIES: ATP-binding protein [Nonomuraea]|uniref:Anti-sigma regulatory factor (Ser/Thr protein kinase) n=2 Tax=Nonomuraea TaxID=83681 RepID=A0A7W5VIB2_9ACTN|nr:ATP-binding protein [Nonomuraea dietziae]MBB3732508.1 anti-sigma regulatory factor (Ser/Thr protein kinase) [Nonomuraea dietziae]